MPSSIQAILSQLGLNGFCYLEAIDGPFVWDLATALGDPTADRRDPQLIRSIRPQDLTEAKENTLSSRYGLGPFPFHTDVAHWTTPARYVLLYCVDPGSGARPTLLSDSVRWNLSRTESRLLCNEVWKTGHRSPRLCTVGSMADGTVNIRFDPGCMLPLTEGARKTQQIIEAALGRAPQDRIDWRPGDLLVIDNYRVLHARGSTLARDTDRILERILVGGLI